MISERGLQCLQRSSEDLPLCVLKAVTHKPEHKEYQKIQAIVDSGAAAHVMPAGLLPDHTAVEGEAKRQGVSYTTADGGEIPNLGEKAVAYKTFEGHSVRSVFQVADVRRPLLSVPRLTASGHDVKFHDQGGVITHPDRKGAIGFKRRGGLFILDMWVAPFARQG